MSKDDKNKNQTETDGSANTATSNTEEFFTREELLGKTDRRYMTVKIPEYGKKIRIQSLTAAERAKYEASMMNKRGGTHADRVKEARERLFALTNVDGKGNLMFGPNDYIALGKVDVAILERGCVAASELSRINAADFDELVGNSEETPSSASG